MCSRNDVLCDSRYNLNYIDRNLYILYSSTLIKYIYIGLDQLSITSTIILIKIAAYFINLFGFLSL